MSNLNNPNSLQVKPLEFPIVGIGASAGGLSAFKDFFEGYDSKECDATFIIVQHLLPFSESYLCDILGRYSELNVIEAENEMTLEANRIYVIKPNMNMSIVDNKLLLTDINVKKGLNNPINHFFESLAESQVERSIAVILSGSGSDGTAGIKSVKETGGFILVQNPESAEYDEMPKSAIKTGLVDYIVEAKKMGVIIAQYIQHHYVLADSSEEFIVENNLYSMYSFNDIVSLIYKKTGYDFSDYKPNTIKRRLARRLLAKQMNRLEDYYQFLLNNPSEIQILFNVLLIGVTNFFRDKDAFEYLGKVIGTHILEKKRNYTPIRIWCAGCSTGEEVYSIAILLKEQMEHYDVNFNIQIFATDINKESITTARKGIYSTNIENNVSDIRLKKYFSYDRLTDTYVVKNEIRKLVVFSVQSVIKDPPFSNIDLVCCRNLLIYFNQEIQNKIMPLFHYALNPKGILFLGKSESLGKSNNLFDALDNHYKVYQKNDDFNKKQLANLLQLFPSKNRKKTLKNIPSPKLDYIKKQPLHEVMEKVLLKEYDLSGILADKDGNILYIHGNVGDYLSLSTGETTTNNVLNMAREGLKSPLLKAFKKLVEDHVDSELNRVNIKKGHLFICTDIVLKHVSQKRSSTEESLYLIIFKNSITVSDGNLDSSAIVEEPALSTLKAELKIKENYLRTINDELEITNMELLISNGDIQLMNEELQSANEELETSKEELQSINEELSTVNSELRVKVDDLMHTNKDINNLLSATNVATVFIDKDKRIIRFTTTITDIINLIASDVGRPLSHFTTNFVEYSHFDRDIDSVLDTLKPIETEVVTKSGLWYTMLIQPYKSTENIVKGIVITFINVTEVKYAETLLNISEEKYRRLFETSRIGILLLDDVTGKITDVNPFLIELLGYSKSEFLEMALWDLAFNEDIKNNKLNVDILQRNEYIQYNDLPIKTKNGIKIDVEFISNVYNVGNKKVIQCNVLKRNSSHV